MNYSEEGTQSECLCCCGVIDKRRTLITETDGDIVDGGGQRLKTCLFCWCMGCNEEGVYIWLKNLLLVYNFCFWLVGWGLIALGVYSGMMRDEYSNEADLVLLTPAVVLTIIGSLSLIFSTLGGVGALRDNLCFLKLFVYSILFFLIIELTCGILALVFREPAKNFVNHYVLKGLTTYYDDQDLMDVVDHVQKEFKCCGGQSYVDWEVNIYHNCSSPGPKACGVPYSCCKKINNTLNINSMCGYDTIAMGIGEATVLIYTDGCVESVIDYLFTNLNVLAGILLGIFLPQVTGVFLGIFYVSSVERFVSKQVDKEFQEMTTISVRALNRDSLYTDEEKRLSYPLYTRKPSLLPEGDVSPTQSAQLDALDAGVSDSELESLCPELNVDGESEEVFLKILSPPSDQSESDNKVTDL